MDNVSVNFELLISCLGDNSSVQELGSAIDKVNERRGLAFPDGALIDQCDVFFHDILSITTADEVDLNGSVLKDAFLVGLAITKLKALFIKNLTGVELQIGGAANPLVFLTTEATEKLILPINGQWMMIWPGNGITITGAGELEFTHAGAGAQPVELICAGVR